MVELIILGIICHAGRSLHGYEIKKYMRDHYVGEYAEVSYGSIYYNLGRMEKEGLIKGTSVKDTQRPERRLYQVTSKGKTRLMKLLRQNYFEMVRLYHPFDIGVSMMELMPREEVLAALEKRISTTGELLGIHRKERDKLRGKIPFYALAILEHSLHYFEAEKKWLEELKREVEVRKEWQRDKGKSQFEDLKKQEKPDESD